VTYWEDRYASGGNSGAGSRGRAARIKAQLVNSYVRQHRITEVLDIGCGDGYVARGFEIPDYLGVDISETALDLARRRNPTKRFELLFDPEPREAHLSFDVLFHLISDEDYEAHMALLFSARSHVLVWATDHSEQGAPHVLHRHWTPDVPEGWRLEVFRPYQPAGFYAFRR
jgi:SAM-dependent methyltransferase